MLLGARLIDAVAAAVSPPILRVPDWDDLPGVVHGFCGRRGGISSEPFVGLNLSFRVGDDAAAVHANWERLRRALGGLHVVTMRQVHGADVATLAAPPAVAPEVDALVTRTAGLTLGVLTADCVPILLVAPQRRVVAAVHAGWRGTLAGVAARALHDLLSVAGHAAGGVRVALGPAIDGCCYTVGQEIADAFTHRWGRLAGIGPAAAGGKVALDLRRANAALLERAGVPARQITTIGPCTGCAHDEYFSHRASGGRTGRQLSFIGWGT